MHIAKRKLSMFDTWENIGSANRDWKDEMHYD